MNFFIFLFVVYSIELFKKKPADKAGIDTINSKRIICFALAVYHECIKNWYHRSNLSALWQTKSFFPDTKFA